MIKLESCLAQHKNAAWRVYDGEAVVITSDDSTLHTLNPVGTRIWESLDGTRALAVVVRQIVEEYRPLKIILFGVAQVVGAPMHEG